MIAVDLFCGGGGATLGLQWAGFEVIGIDIRKPRAYTGHFIKADALRPPIDLKKADFVWASPPCQRYSSAGKCRGNDWQRHPDMVPALRELLKDHPFTCIENVPGSPLRKNLWLVGEQFGLNQLWRKRYFELSFFCWQLPKVKMQRGKYITVTTSMSSANHFYRRKAEGKKGRPPMMLTKHVMGIPICNKMTQREVGNAVPPPMARYIATEAMREIRAPARSAVP